MSQTMDQAFLRLVSRYLRQEIHVLENNTATHLKAMGLDSMMSIHLICDIEEMYDIEFPDEYLVDDTFSSMEVLWKITQSLSSRLSQGQEY